mmetsp:Transcript_102261/g.284878  ORF Transcript_102261/g.284878 Transcript_102261/m.284878 type:complete len:297 (+) Transcript_102261:574-1464(+)
MPPAVAVLAPRPPHPRGCHNCWCLQQPRLDLPLRCSGLPCQAADSEPPLPGMPLCPRRPPLHRHPLTVPMLLLRARPAAQAPHWAGSRCRRPQQPPLMRSHWCLCAPAPAAAAWAARRPGPHQSVAPRPGSQPGQQPCPAGGPVPQLPATPPRPRQRHQPRCRAAWACQAALAPHRAGGWCLRPHRRQDRQALVAVRARRVGPRRPVRRRPLHLRWRRHPLHSGQPPLDLRLPRSGVPPAGPSLSDMPPFGLYTRGQHAPAQRPRSPPRAQCWPQNPHHRWPHHCLQLPLLHPAAK